MSLPFFNRPPDGPVYTGIQISTSAAAIPVPICYGVPLVPTNIIEATDFRSHGGGGKKNSKGGSSSTYYTIDCMLALGEGPATEPPGNALALRLNGLYYPIGQAPRGTYVAFDYMPGPPFGFASADLRPYPGVVIFRATGLNASTNASVPQMEILLGRRLYRTCPLNNDPNFGLFDADPAQCIIDILTSPRFGAGFPISFIFGNNPSDPNNGLPGSFWSGPNAGTSGDAAFQTYCQAVGFGFSCMVRNAEPMSSILTRWAKIMACAPVWNGLIFKFIPYWDSAANDNPGWYSGNTSGPGGSTLPLKTFVPNTTPIFDFGDNDFVQTKENEDPVELNRLSTADIPNIIRVTFKDRQNEFNSNLAWAFDEASMDTDDFYTPFIRVEEVQAAEEFTFVGYAQASANALLARSTSIRTRGTFRLGWEYAMLDPMDIITITDANLGLSRWPARLTKIEEQEDSTLLCEFEEFPIGAASPANLAAQGQGSNNGGINTNISPANVNAPFIFEPTNAELVAEGATTAEIAFGVSGGTGGIADPNWGGAAIFVSLDGGATYTQYSTINGPSTMGVLGAPLAAFSGPNPDNTHTLTVDLSESATTLASVSAGQAATLLPSLCAIQNGDGSIELLSYTLATPLGGFKYHLTGLYRGVYGTAAGAHGTGSLFVFIPGVLPRITELPGWVGQTLYFKFLSFNVYGNQEQALAGVSAYTYVPTGIGF